MKNIVKMSFDQVDSFFRSLDYAFHPRGIDDEDGPDSRFMALWTIFLTYAGWTEDEYWEADNYVCPECKKEQEEVNKKEAN